jgi:hypothetical protein
MRVELWAVAAALALTGCGGPTVVNNDEPRPETPQAAPPPPPPLNNTNLVNGFYYGAPVNGTTQYFFTTPSGRWQCHIVPRVQAGCQATGGDDLDIPGAPETVLDATGEEATPNAVVVSRDGDPAFIAVEGTPFAPDPGPANTLGFNQVLAVAGFRCNVQEATGISCVSERSRRGFTFSAEGFMPQYVDVPAGAPITPPTSPTG